MVVIPAFMERALQLAAKSLTLSSPNPRVGCLIVGDCGEILGEGFTQRAGDAHAEVMALRDAQSRGLSVFGATAYVTLEPCAHHGRTGPCCDALANAGIKYVVASIEDPNPLVAGKGFARLVAQGVQVQVGLGSVASRDLNIGFFSRMIRKKPWVRVKVAASLDGRTALENGESQWITGEAARADGHALRARACALLTGIGTILKDDPQLNVRLPSVQRQPDLIILDSWLKTPIQSKIFKTDRKVFIYTNSFNKEKINYLEESGANVINLKSNNPNEINLNYLVEDIGKKEINELHIEAGNKINGSFFSKNLVDEVVFYLAPTIIGKGLNIAEFGPLLNLDQSIPLKFISTEFIGLDIKVVARVTGSEEF